MKRVFFNFLVVICTVSFFAACNVNDDLLLDHENQGISQEIPAIIKDETFVSLTDAASVAGAFFNKQSNGALVKSSVVSSKTDALVVMVEDDINGSPLMYVVNYPEGGFVIVSATRDYYPILAYSEENNFELTSEMGGLLVWMDEVKQDIRASSSADDEFKANMRSMWASYKTAERSQDAVTNLKSSNPLQEAYDRRFEELNYQYGYSGWTFCNFYSADLPYSAYSQIMQNCENYNCSPEYVIVGIKSTYSNQTVGPLIQTNWHQDFPYNSLVPNQHSAGCGAVAMAQIMNYHKYPASLSFNGVAINWNNMPADAPRLIAATGAAANTTYWSIGSWALPGAVESALRSQFMYTVSRQNHNSGNAAAQLLNYQRPVLMVGFPAALNPDGHYWVCDGAQSISYESFYFAEYPRPLGYQTYYYDSMSGNPWAGNPGNGNSYGYLYFHMNWGWEDINKNTWYIHTHNGGFSNYRDDYFISK